MGSLTSGAGTEVRLPAVRLILTALLTLAATPALGAAVWEPQVGDRFPDLRLPTLEEGVSRSISEFRGEKILLHVFASW